MRKIKKLIGHVYNKEVTILKKTCKPQKNATSQTHGIL